MLCFEEAMIYGAGSSTRMPTDVIAVFGEVLCQQGGVPKKGC
jgi:hypothetical protein